MVTQLIHFSRARQELALATKVDEIKEIRDKAEALRVYVKQAGESLEMQNQCAEIKIRAERRGGEILANQERHEGGRPTKNLSHRVIGFAEPPKLSELGISLNQSHHWQTIASLLEEDFERHIAETKDRKQELTSIGVLRLAQKQNRTEYHASLHVKPFPEGKFAVIYADPAWQYSNTGFDESAESQYRTLATNEICAFTDPDGRSVSDLCDETTVLFLWGTNPLLPDALEVMAAWDFEYKTNMAWIKDRARGKGWFLISKHELLLIGTRRKTPHPLVRPESSFSADRGRIHSRKPEEAYKIIESMYLGPKIEIFGRNEREGWKVWGDEV